VGAVEVTTEADSVVVVLPTLELVDSLELIELVGIGVVGAIVSCPGTTTTVPFPGTSSVVTLETVVV